MIGKSSLRHRRHFALCLASGVLIGCGLMWQAEAHQAMSGNVRIVSTIDSGGTVQSGDDVRIAGFIGAAGVVSTGGTVVARQGGNSMIYYATAFTVTADAATINEQGAPETHSTRTQLRGEAVYDDSTLGAIDGSQIAWAAPATNSSLASISAEGVAEASAVYQHTVALYTGLYESISATGSLTVLNVLPDNFSVWAGDTFDDAWEISQGMTNGVNPDALNNGVPNWQLYAMGFNPEQPAPAVLASSVVTNGYFGVRYTRNPYATGYLFTPQESPSLPSGFSNMIAPVSFTNNLPDGSDQIITQGSVPVSSTRRQFLRVRITRPSP